MQKHSLLKFYFIFFIIASCNTGDGQNAQNWTSKDLTEPASLATALQQNKNVPMIFSVGPDAVIPNSVDIGMVKDEKNLEKFRSQLTKLPKDTNILIYCGCCPFEHCPDVRPAIALLQQMRFTNYHLLDLPHNIKTDWIGKGYPTVK